MAAADSNSEAKSPSTFEQHIQPFLEEFAKETDRAAVILGAAKLDSLLYQILRKALIAEPSAEDSLLDPEGPLGSFYGKIGLAYRLGLIDNELARGLHLIRKIRNAFAHELSNVNLESGPQHDRLRELILSFEKLPYFPHIAGFFQDKAGLSGSFRTTLALIVVGLETRNRAQKSLALQTPSALMDRALDKAFTYLHEQDESSN